MLEEAVRFCIVGGLATVIHYGVYWLLQQIINVNVAYTIGYVVSFIVNYILSARFTFKKQTTMSNGVGFAGAHVFNYLLQMGLLNTFLAIGVSKTLAPLPVYCIAVPVNFLIVRWVFGHFHKKEQNTDKEI